MLFFNLDDDKGINKNKTDKDNIIEANNNFYNKMKKIKNLSVKLDKNYDKIKKTIDKKKNNFIY
jgi:hypothetical protein